MSESGPAGSGEGKKRGGASPGPFSNCVGLTHKQINVDETTLEPHRLHKKFAENFVGFQKIRISLFAVSINLCLLQHLDTISAGIRVLAGLDHDIDDKGKGDTEYYKKSDPDAKPIV